MTNIRVELAEDGKRIELDITPYSVALTERAKSVLGQRWNPERKVRTYPVRWETCLALREAMGPEMKVGPRLTAWAAKAKKQDAKAREISSAMDSPLSAVKESHPAFWTAMSRRTYQRSGAEFMAMKRFAACFDEPGLGKSAELLAAVIQAGLWEGRHLIVVSNKTAIRSTWRREIQRWAPDAKVYAMPDGWRAREETLEAFMADETGARFLVCLPHMLQVKVEQYCKKCDRWDGDKGHYPIEHFSESHKTAGADKKCEWPELFTIDWNSVIADECHDYLLKMKTTSAAKQPQWAIGMKRLTKNSKMRLAATGTPFRGKEINLYGILHWLDPVKYSSYWRWVEAYFEIEQKEFKIRGGGGRTGSQKTVGNLKPSMVDAFYQQLDGIALRRQRQEVRDDMPDKDIQEHWVEMTPTQRVQYEEFERDGEVAVANGIIEGRGTLSELTRLRQMAFSECDVEFRDDPDAEIPEGMEEYAYLYQQQIQRVIPLVRKSPKVELMMDMLRERGLFEKDAAPDAPKYIIASQFVAVVNEIRDMLIEMGCSVLVITGEIGGNARSRAVTDFTTPGGARVLLLNTKAGGASLTLDEFCDEMFILDETWVHDDQVQLMGRIDNRGARIVPRSFHYFRTEGTIDEKIAYGNNEQNAMQNMILDARRGRDFAVSLLRRAQ